MKTTISVLRLAVFSTSLGLLASCGGGGGGGGDSGGSAAGASVGVLLDAEVQGVSYKTSPSNLSGVTNSLGQYNYRPGDTVTFSLGDIEIGSAPASGTLTPRDLANNMTLPLGVTVSDVVSNIAIFLQTFDSDGNPSNGIQINDPALLTAAAGQSLDFAQSTAAFVGDATLASLAGSTYAVVDAEAALDHLAETEKKRLVGSWREIYNGAGIYNVFSFFPDGTYIAGYDLRDDPNCTSGIERGTYTIDPVTAELTIDTISIDSTGPSGDCGLFEDGQSVVMTLRFTNATTLEVDYEDSANPTDAGTLTFSKVVSNGASGSWVQYDGSGSPISVLTLLADGTYTQVEAEVGGTKNGLEFGTWSRNATTGAITSASIVDNNQESGPSNGTGISIAVSAADFGFLKVTDESDPAPTLLAPHPYQLKLAGNTASSVGGLVSSACPSAPVGWLFTFGTSNFTVQGSDGWVDCVAKPEGTETWVYTEFDGPFNCGDAICDWFEMNKVITGTDGDGRGFTSTYTHVPGSWTYDVVKEITSGSDTGTTYSEHIVIGDYLPAVPL